jgi:pimeloyl-ACP methyl ester carboxylesterase
LDGAELGADAVAAWAPVTNGRRWGRELRLLASAVPDADDPLHGGTVAMAGLVYSRETLADISALSVAGIARAPAARVLLVDGQPDPALAEHLRALDVDVTIQAAPGGEGALESATEDAIVPMAVVESIRAWLAPASGTAAGAPADRPHTAAAPARFAWRGGEVQEQVMSIGPSQLTTIRTDPTAESGRTARGTLVFLNTGSEPHVGPGRAWVELARSLALRGHRCYRVDWRGWGESPDDGHGPGRPYDPHTVTDTVQLVRALQHDGADDIVLCGLCASAWVALRAVLQVDVAGVVALNPQLYWAPGDPVEATLAQTRRRRAQEILDIEAGAASGRWTAEDLAGRRPWAAAWLDELSVAASPITRLFAEGDDGLEYLNLRLERRLAEAREAGLRVVELAGVDHSMHRVWTRPLIVDAIAAAVADMLSS